MKQTDFELYMDTWRKDDGLRSCSLAARGLWADMFIIMHEAKHYGFLTLKNGQPLYATQLSRITGVAKSTLKRLIAELEHAGVLYRNLSGQLYANCMVKHYEA